MTDADDTITTYQYEGNQLVGQEVVDGQVIVNGQPKVIGVVSYVSRTKF